MACRRGAGVLVFITVKTYSTCMIPHQQGGSDFQRACIADTFLLPLTLLRPDVPILFFSISLITVRQPQTLTGLFAYSPESQGTRRHSGTINAISSQSSHQPVRTSIRCQSGDFRCWAWTDGLSSRLQE